MGTVSVEEANDTIMGGVQCLIKLIFVAPKFILHRVPKSGKKEQKIKNCVLQKKTFLFLHVHELGIVLGVSTDRKNHDGKVCSPKKFFDFSHQLRCALWEISSYPQILNSKKRVMMPRKCARFCLF